MQRACRMPRDQDTRGQKGEEGVGGMPRILLSKVYARGLKGGRGQGDQGQGPWGPGRGAREDEGGRAHKGQGLARERQQRGGAGRAGCLANCSAPCSRWPEGGGKEVEARGQRHAKHGPNARGAPRLE